MGKSLPCDPGSELRLGGREKRRAKTTNRMKKRKEQYVHLIRFEFFRERTAKSKIWSIRQRGGEANSNPYLYIYAGRIFDLISRELYIGQYVRFKLD